LRLETLTLGDVKRYDEWFISEAGGDRNRTMPIARARGWLEKSELDPTTLQHIFGVVLAAQQHQAHGGGCDHVTRNAWIVLCHLTQGAVQR
jgi:hypothetical protein